MSENALPWIAYVDTTDGSDRESFSVFYGEMFFGADEATAQKKADDFVARTQPGQYHIHTRRVDG